MTTRTETIAPDGKPFAMTLRTKGAISSKWRILFGPVPDVSRGDNVSYVLAGESGTVIVISERAFLDILEYIPGGQ